MSCREMRSKRRNLVDRELLVELLNSRSKSNLQPLNSQIKSAEVQFASLHDSRYNLCLAPFSPCQVVFHFFFFDSCFVSLNSAILYLHIKVKFLPQKMK